MSLLVIVNLFLAAYSEFDLNLHFLCLDFPIDTVHLFLEIWNKVQCQCTH
jgi:hypothetical protein